MTKVDESYAFANRNHEKKANILNILAAKSKTSESYTFAKIIFSFKSCIKRLKVTFFAHRYQPRKLTIFLKILATGTAFVDKLFTNFFFERWENFNIFFSRLAKYCRNNRCLLVDQPVWEILENRFVRR